MPAEDTVAVATDWIRAYGVCGPHVRLHENGSTITTCVIRQGLLHTEEETAHNFPTMLCTPYIDESLCSAIWGNSSVLSTGKITPDFNSQLIRRTDSSARRGSYLRMTGRDVPDS